MQKKRKRIITGFSLIFLFLLGACASGQRQKAQDELRDAFSNNRYEDCLKAIDSVNPGSDEDSKLLYYMERGMIFHDAGKYYLSAHFLEKAREVDRMLFTKSISSATQTYLVNDTSGKFYGSSYERSSINYYLALNYFLLYQTGKVEEYTLPEYSPSEKFTEVDAKKVIPAKILTQKERIDALNKARASILAWDSFLNTLKNDRLGKSVFKDDLMAKLLGAFIHESFRKHSEDEIALQLYKDAKDVLLKNYNAYKTFNKKSSDFKSNFSKFPEMSLDQVKSGYISETSYQKELEAFIQSKIASLSSAQKEKDRSNVTVLLETGLVPEKIAKKYVIGFQTVLDNIEDPGTRSNVQMIGSLVLGQFVADVLGLRGGLGQLEGAVAVNVAAISFELPQIKNFPHDKSVVVKVFNDKGDFITEKNLAMLQPFNDIAEEAVDEDSTARYLRTGVRVGLKHLTAILAAYGTYVALANKGDEFSKFMAKSAALASYLAASKGIEYSERADTRYWSTLPNSMRAAAFNLKQGKYNLKAFVLSAGKEVASYDLDILEIKDPNTNYLVNKRLKSFN